MSIIVKSIELLKVDFEDTQNLSSNNLTKNQNYQNCVPFMTNYAYGRNFDSRLFDMYFSGTIESGIINFERYGPGVATKAKVVCYVVEFDPSEVRVQQGSFNIDSTTSGTVTVPTTLSGTDKTAMVFAWKSNNNTNTVPENMVRGRILDENSIDFYRYTGTNELNGHWFLFEDFKDNFIVKHKNSTNVTGELADIVAINDDNNLIDPLRTFLLGSFSSSYSTIYADRNSIKINRLSDGAVAATKQLTTGDFFWNCQVIEFLDKTKIYTPFYHGNEIKILNGSSKIDLDVGGVVNNPFLCDLESSSIVSPITNGISFKVASTYSNAHISMSSAAELTSSGTITIDRYYTGYDCYPQIPIAVDWNGIAVNTEVNNDVIPEGNGDGQSFVKSVENFRIILDDVYGLKVLGKGQVWNNCVVFSTIYNTGATNISDVLVNSYISAPGIVYFRSNASVGQTIHVDVSVVEFWPEQIKIQRKNIFLDTETSFNVSIEEVSSINKCFIISKSNTNEISGNIGNNFVRVSFLDNSNVQLHRYSSSSKYKVDLSLFVVEDLQNNFVSKHFSNSFSTNTQKIHDTYFWDVHKSFAIVSYAYEENTDYSYRNFVKASIKSEFNPVDLNRGTSSAFNILSYTTIVKFLSNKIHIYNIDVDFYNIAQITGNYLENFNDNSLTCYNAIQHNCMYYSSSYKRIRFIFASIRVSDYNTNTYEITRGGNITESTLGSFAIIDWVGYNNKNVVNPINNTPTKSIIQSIQKYDYYNKDASLELNITKGQNIEKCVPFIINNRYHNAELISYYKTITRYTDLDKFIVRFGLESINSDADTTIYILEFSDKVKVQYGSNSISTTSEIINIEEINKDRSFLVFYHFSDTDLDKISSIELCGRIKSATELEFNRSDNECALHLDWYVVECLEGEDYWTVDHLYSTNLGISNNILVKFNNIVNTSSSMFLCSWAVDGTTTAYPYRDWYSAHANSSEFILNSYTSGDQMTNLNIQVIKINNSRFKSLVNYAEFPAGSLLEVDTETFNIDNQDRITILNANQQNQGQTSSSYTRGFAQAMIHSSIKDATTFISKRKQVSEASNSYFYAYEWPEYNAYYFEGYTTENDNFVSRDVYLYKTSNMELVSKTTSSGNDGYFLLETPYYDEHHIICLDDAAGSDYNHLIYGKMFPTVISGCFAHNEGLTVSGVHSAVPLIYR